MTGYGKATCEYEGKKICVEIKSLNSKQLDVNMRVANCYRENELKLRNMLLQGLERGKVDFALYIENAATQGGAQINTELFGTYYRQIKAISEQLKVEAPSDWFNTILNMPDVMKSEERGIEEAEWAVVYATVEAAIANLTNFRVQEGVSLAGVFTAKLGRISELLTEVEQYEGERVAKIRTRIVDNLQKLAESAKVDYDKNRLEQEMIFYVEKLDINEEKVRLRNHLNYFAETMNTEHAAGKKLGFVAQEMGREINTLGSKSNHSEMQIIVVQMKDELEQIKEQVLNVL